MKRGGPVVERPRRFGWSRRSSVCAASALSGVLTMLAFPPFGVWFLAFVAPLPLVWAAGHVRGGRFGALIAATLGMAPAWAWEQQWVFGVSAVGAPLMVLHLALYAGVFVWVLSWASERLRAPVWLLGPVVWAGLEMLRGVVLWEGYPWLLAGHPVIGSVWLARAAGVIGAFGVSFLTVAVGMSAYGVVVSRGRWRAAGAVLLAGVCAVWVVLSSRPPVATEGVLRVAVVQTNVAQSVKLGWPANERMRDLDRMLELSREACEAETAPELVVWPETMFPGGALDADSLNEVRAAEREVGPWWSTEGDAAWPVLRYICTRGDLGVDPAQAVRGPLESRGRLWMYQSVAADSLFAMQEHFGAPFLVGAEGTDGLSLPVSASTGRIEYHDEGMFNSSYLLDGGRVVGERYDKMQLTPFGEVMPYISSWPWLERQLLRIGVGAEGMAFELTAGSRPVTHVVQTASGLVRVATPICFEGIMSGVCRRLAYSGGERQADVLIQLTNEGWFGGFDGAREQHLQIVRWRAVELGTSVVRAANTGVSAVIGPDGRVLVRGVGAGDWRVDGVLWGEAPLATGGTVYARFGDVVGWANLAGLGAILLAGMVIGRRGHQRRGAPAADEEGGGSAGV